MYMLWAHFWVNTSLSMMCPSLFPKQSTLRTIATMKDMINKYQTLPGDILRSIAERLEDNSESDDDIIDEPFKIIGESGYGSDLTELDNYNDNDEYDTTDEEEVILDDNIGTMLVEKQFLPPIIQLPNGRIVIETVL
jgi:hypothetical protein